MRILGHRYPPIALADATVAITGAGRGIGRATAAEFAAAGARVALGDLDADTALDTAHEIGSNAAAFALDVTSRGSVDAFLEAAAAEFGPVDVLVNNAGVMPIARFLDEPDSISATTLDVNVWGPIHGMRAVLPTMIARGRGHIVNVASMAGKQHLPGLAVYCASKFAVVGLTATVRDEVAVSGVSVSAVLPSMVKTELASGISVPSPLAVEPEDIAAAIVDSVRTRDGEIAVPGWLGPANAAMAITPAAVSSLLRRVARFDRGLDALEQPARADYTTRVSQQAQQHRYEHGHV